MNRPHLAMLITALNSGMLLYALAQGPAATAGEVAPVLRGRALELVDERGRVRAEIKVLPADPALKMPDGTTGYPETVQLRLIDSKGGPNVKLVATEDGSGLVLGGESSYVQILARGGSPFLKIVSKDGREETIQAGKRGAAK